jgi:hypothetical protein
MSDSLSPAVLRSHMWDKYLALKDALYKLNTSDPEDLPDLEGARRNISLEMRFTMDLITNIGTSPIAFPGPEEVRRLRDAVGRLQTAVRNDVEARALLAVATQVVKTWPVSEGG